MTVGFTGLTAWWVQRVTAVYMLIFVVLVLGAFSLCPRHSYLEWRAWVGNPGMTVAIFGFFAALLSHMWVGLRDVLMRLKQEDDSLAFRKSCREGVCGSDAMNINGRNGLACITSVSGLREPVILRPLPSFPIIRDLVVDMTNFFNQYHSISPYLINPEPPPEKERLQSPAEREKLNGSYECILCACCSAQCPSYWWNPDKFVGPAGLIQAYRFIVDSRDRATQQRLDDLNDAYRLFRCRTIMNCAEVCPKGLEPVHAIEKIRLKMSKVHGDGGGLEIHRPISPR